MTKITADSSTWPKRGSMWIVNTEAESNTGFYFFRQHQLQQSDIIMFTKMVYVTKCLITAQFLSDKKVHTVTFPPDDWDNLFQSWV